MNNTNNDDDNDNKRGQEQYQEEGLELQGNTGDNAIQRKMRVVRVYSRRSRMLERRVEELEDDEGKRREEEGFSRGGKFLFALGAGMKRSRC